MKGSLGAFPGSLQEDKEERSKKYLHDGVNYSHISAKFSGNDPGVKRVGVAVHASPVHFSLEFPREENVGYF